MQSLIHSEEIFLTIDDLHKLHKSVFVKHVELWVTLGYTALVCE